jgi:hypothetical protein
MDATTKASAKREGATAVVLPEVADLLAALSDARVLEVYCWAADRQAALLVSNKPGARARFEDVRDACAVFEDYAITRGLVAQRISFSPKGA